MLYYVHVLILFLNYIKPCDLDIMITLYLVISCLDTSTVYMLKITRTYQSFRLTHFVFAFFSSVSPPLRSTERKHYSLALFLVELEGHVCYGSYSWLWPASCHFGDLLLCFAFVLLLKKEML